MTDADALLQAILDDPADDGARLAYSDALEEAGDVARAEFIRVQLAMARIDVEVASLGKCHCSGFDPTGCARCREGNRRGLWRRRDDLRRRERELLNRHFSEWTNSFPEETVTKQCPTCVDQTADWETSVIECRKCDCTGLVECRDNVEFRRGFVAKVRTTLAGWWGRECPKCGGVGGTIHGSEGKCSDCRGTGCIPGHGPAIVQQQPVERVETEKKPDLEEDGLWRWYAGDYDAEDTIPLAVAKCMTPAIRAYGAFALGSEAAFATETAAQNALSAALLAWAKKEVPCQV